MAERVLCGQCRRELGDEPERRPCPTCGSAARTFEVSVAETITVYDSVKFKLKRPGRKEPAAEGMSGWELCLSTGKMVQKESLFDRENDRRYERVDGKVIHDHRLSEHKGHGSDKPAYKESLASKANKDTETKD